MKARPNRQLADDANARRRTDRSFNHSLLNLVHRAGSNPERELKRAAVGQVETRDFPCRTELNRKETTGTALDRHEIRAVAVHIPAARATKNNPAPTVTAPMARATT